MWHASHTLHGSVSEEQNHVPKLVTIGSSNQSNKPFSLANRQPGQQRGTELMLLPANNSS